MHKKTILIFVDWYVPGYLAGGPIKSVFSLVEYLKDEFNFLIITSDKDFGEEESYPSVLSNQWNKLGDNISVFYASENYLNYSSLSKIIESVKFDCIYLNSFFSYKFSILPLILMKFGKINSSILLAPRGMLGSGALKLKSFKKKFFIQISKLLSLHKKIHFQSTSKQETDEIKSVFGDECGVFEIPNLQYIEEGRESKKTEKKAGVLRLLFLSRVSEKKNLSFALSVLNRIDFKNADVLFDIYGPIEDEHYWKICSKLIEDCNANNIKVNYNGSIESSKVSQVFDSYHFLFLPTFNENYGHVIVESFQSGTPVIISDQTPWVNLEKLCVGWDISLNHASKFENILEKCALMNSSEYNVMSNNCKNYFFRNCNSLDSIKEYITTFNKLIHE